jgi:hypothetical protein
VQKDKQGYFFVYSMKAVGSSTWVAANFRLEREDGTPAVAQALFRYDGRAEPATSARTRSRAAGTARGPATGPVRGRVAAPLRGRAGGPIELTAEALVKECKADRAKAEAKYTGKVLWVTGRVSSVYEDILYLNGGKDDMVGIRYGKGNKPAVRPGDTATFDGTFDRVAVLGPALVGCKLVPADRAGK